MSKKQYKCLDENIYDHMVCDEDHPLLDYKSRREAPFLLVPRSRDEIKAFLNQDASIEKNRQKGYEAFNMLSITKIEDYAIWSDNTDGRSWKTEVPFTQEEIFISMHTKHDKLKIAVFLEWKNSLKDGRRHEKNRIVFGDSQHEKPRG